MCPCSCTAETRSPRSYGTSARTSTAGSGSAASIAARSSSMPSPVRDDTKSAFGSRPRSTSRVSSSTRSALLKTTISRMSRAPTSPITSRTVASCAAGSGCARVDDVHDDVGVADLFERRAEGLDELVRQVAHEADGVGQRVHAAVGGLGAADGGIERREQRVLDEHARAGEPVEQARLAGVRVAGDRDRGDRVALALGPLRVARGREVADLTAQQRHPRADAAAVELDLGLTGSARAHARAARADLATGLTAHRVTPAAQAREEVLELGELDLRLALAALGVLAEDVEDDRRCGR